jgi:ADP-heptose:LPS heptosyltransferase
MFSLLEARRPVVFFANGLGDAILNLPALRALATLFHGRLTLVCDRGFHELWFSELPLKTVVESRMCMEDGGRQFCVTVVGDSISECDLFLSLVPWHSKSLKALLEYLRPTASIGFFPDFDITLPRDYGKHSADLCFDLPKYLDPSLNLEDYATPPQFPPEVWRKARHLRSLLPDFSRILAVHTETVSEKVWPYDRLVAALDIFLDRHNDFLVLVVGCSDNTLDVGRHGKRVIPAYGLPLILSCCLVAQADAFLGVDSCMLHVADFCRVPGVGLFGPTKSTEFGFRLSCHRHVCGDGAMNRVSVASVTEALDSLLAEVDTCRDIHREQETHLI